MGSLKSINKSVRMSEEMYSYIDAYRGEGFNQKFENIIMDAREAEPRLKQRLAALEKRHETADNELRDKLKKLDELTSAVRNLSRTYTWF